MALTKSTTTVNNIQGLGDLVQNQATAVKVLFDKTGADLKVYINDVLIPDIEDQFATNEALTGVIAGTVNLVDTADGTKYAWGITSGLLYLEEVL